MRLEKYRQGQNVIKKLESDKGETLEHTDSILGEIYSFYSNLYSCVEIHEEEADDFLSCIDQTVSDGKNEILNAEISSDDVRTALQGMARNKSPGQDGLTVEFYCKFYSILNDVFMHIIHEIQETGELSRSMKLGVISLVYKNKGERTKLKNWRPISLLNVDYKILARIMSNRLKRVLPDIISPYQSCCIMGRDISDNISNVRDIIDLVEKDNLEGYILKIDQEEAFDRVSHTYLSKVLDKFGFSDFFIQWMNFFYNGIHSSVKCNGFMTKFSPIKNSVRQGCPISALIYVLVAEPLGQSLLKNEDIRGIPIPLSDKCSKVFQHADDTTLTLANTTSINEVFNVLEKYGRASGAKVNKDKSEILCIGTGTLSASESDAYQVKLLKDVIQVLGVFLGPNSNSCNSLNWNPKLNSMRNVLNMWSQRQLTIQGRATVITSLLLSKCWYVLIVTSIPEIYKVQFKNICLNFLWKNGAHLVGYKTVIGLKANGGLQIPDIDLKMKSFRIKFAFRLLNDEYALWKETCNYFLSNVAGMKLGLTSLCCTFKDSALKDIPSFYREMLVAWSDIYPRLVFDDGPDNIYCQPVFYNPLITNKMGKVLQEKLFIEADLVRLKDFSYEVVPGFLPISAIVELVHEVNPDVPRRVISTLYFEILRSLPQEFVTTVVNNCYTITDVTDPVVCLKINDEGTRTVPRHTREIYRMLVKNDFVKPVALSYWEDVFPDQNTDRVFRIIHAPHYPMECVELHFKVAHRAIFTYKKLYKYGKTNTDQCPVCQTETEDLVHLFLYCTELSDFIDYLVEILKSLFENVDAEKKKSMEVERLLTLGFYENWKNVNSYFVNFILSVARYCIFKRRNLIACNEGNVELISFFKFTVKRFLKYIFHHFSLHKSIFEKYYKQ